MDVTSTSGVRRREEGHPLETPEELKRELLTHNLLVLKGEGLVTTKNCTLYLFFIPRPHTTSCPQELDPS